jgi:hypothetical protein
MLPSRITKHKRPRHQLYQPGFNNRNSCWLEGDWITLDKDEWLRRKGEHERMYSKLPSFHTQKHDGKPTPIGKMDKAQRQAWEHFSGCDELYVVYEKGGTGIVRVNIAGKHIRQDSLDWLRETRVKVLPKIKDQGKETNQAAKYSIPPDLVADQKETADPWMDIVAQNRQREFDMFKECVDSFKRGGNGVPPEFAARMAMTSLVMREESIIQEEWNASVGRADRFDNPEWNRINYVEMRRIAREAFGDDLEPLLGQARDEHNECERHNLDNSDGNLFCFVLPKFHEDGSHEPWGARDVPWNIKEGDNG